MKDNKEAYSFGASYLLRESQKTLAKVGDNSYIPTDKSWGLLSNIPKFLSLEEITPREKREN